MKTPVFLLATAALLAVSAHADPINIDVHALYMTRSDGSSAPLVSTTADPGSGNVFRSSQFEPGFAPGLAGEISTVEDDGMGLAIGGFFVSDATETAKFTGDTGLEIETHPETHYGFGSGDTLTGHDVSAIVGANGFLTWSVDPNWTVYGGVRFIHLTEKFNLFGDFGGGDFENDVWTSGNNMWGGEVGAGTELFKLVGFDAGSWTLDAHADVGLLADSARTEFRNYEPSGVVSDKSATRTQLNASAIALLGLDLAYPVTENVSLSAGYDLIFLSGVETAAGQFPVTGQYNGPPTTLGSHFESVLYNGFEAGLDVHLL